MEKQTQCCRTTLIDIGSETVFESCFLQVLDIQFVNIDFCAIPGRWTTTLADKSCLDGCIGTQFGNQVQFLMSDHPGAGIVTEMSIQDQIFQSDEDPSVAINFSEMFGCLIIQH